MLFNTLANWINDGLWALHTSGHTWVEPYRTLWNRTFSWPFNYGLYELSIAILLLAILAIVVLRFARSRRDEEQMKSELEAARVVQQVLVPAENPSIPGFAIEVVYRPAGQVGGDFYQVIPTASGGVLVAIGDVSGKGMPAAMTMSLLVGTFRTLAHYTQSPGEILRAMNQRMLARSQGGFTTCLVIRVDADGVMIAANAGHIPPYLNGKELAIDSGLPMGLSPESIYGETACCRNTAPGSLCSPTALLRLGARPASFLALNARRHSVQSRRKKSRRPRKPSARKTTSPCLRSPSPRRRYYVRRLAFLLPFLLVAVTPQRTAAQSAATPIVRYHYGDNPVWADPSFDDAGWPVAQEGRWPKPVFDSDGFVWVRTPVPVRIDTSEPLALRIISLSRA